MQLEDHPSRTPITYFTPRLILRHFHAGDVDALYEIQGDSDYMRFTYAAPSRDACATWLQQYVDAAAQTQLAPWTVLHRRERRIIGWGGLNVDPNASQWGPEVSYFMHRDYQGIGLATELVAAALDHGFMDLELSRVVAFARPDNVASIRVLTKCGFEFVGYEAALERNRYAVDRRS